MKIAVAGVGYVGLSIAVLLAQHNQVKALDIVPQKVAQLNEGESPIVDAEIQRFLKEGKQGVRALDLTATCDEAEAYADADFAVVATPTDYDSERNHFNTTSVEAAIAAIRRQNPDCWIVIKSTIPVGYTEDLVKRLGDKKILFSPEFLREGKALYDNLHPSRIIVGALMDDNASQAAAQRFAGLLAEGQFHHGCQAGSNLGNFANFEQYVLQKVQGVVVPFLIVKAACCPGQVDTSTLTKRCDSQRRRVFRMGVITQFRRSKGMLWNAPQQGFRILAPANRL